MRLVKFAAAVLAVTLSAYGSAWAEEIVYFTNGAVLPIRSHAVEDDMLRVTLDADSTMAFPMSLVERIDNHAGHLVFDPALAVNRVVSRSDGAAAPGSAAPGGAAGASSIPGRRAASSSGAPSETPRAVYGGFISRPVAGSGSRSSSAGHGGPSVSSRDGSVNRNRALDRDPTLAFRKEGETPVIDVRKNVRPTITRATRREAPGKKLVSGEEPENPDSNRP